MADGFNLNAVDLALDKPMDESPWAAGYHVELMAGPDSVPGNVVSYTSGGHTYVGTQSGADVSIRQAYLALRTPVGNSGIDWKIGTLDSPLGYESSSDPLNPNYTRSLGYNLEPTTLTGVVGAYKINDEFTVVAAVANAGTAGNALNGSGNHHSTLESQKTYLGYGTFTAPESWGWAKGTTLNAGVIVADSGASGTTGGGRTWLYAGATVPTPMTALKVGAAFDYVDAHNSGVTHGSDDSAWNIGLYANYQINDKASFNVRGEYLNDNGAGPYNGTFGTTAKNPNDNAEEFTATLQYALWANVLSRVELRWDHVEHGKAFDTATDTGTSPCHDNAYLLALNLIYQF